MSSSETRYNWLDVFKAFSIFFILYSHIGNHRLSTFFFSFMVHAFFFASGVTAARNADKPLCQYIKDRFKRLMVPYFAFGIIAIAVIFLMDTHTGFSIADMIKQLLYAYRLNTFAITLWFLPCLFVMGIYYQVLMKFVKNKWVRLAAAAAVSLVFRFFSEGNILPWGIDNAVRFLVYYAAGDAFGGFFNTLSSNPPLILRKKWPLLLCAAGLALVYFQYTYSNTYLIELTGIVPGYMMQVVTGAFYAFVNIYLLSIASIALQNIKLLQTVGKNSLAACCLELPVNRFVCTAISMFGLQVTVTYPGQCIMFVAVCLACSVKAAGYIKQNYPLLLGFSKSR